MPWSLCAGVSPGETRGGSTVAVRPGCTCATSAVTNRSPRRPTHSSASSLATAALQTAVRRDRSALGRCESASAAPQPSRRGEHAGSELARPFHRAFAQYNGRRERLAAGRRLARPIMDQLASGLETVDGASNRPGSRQTFFCTASRTENERRWCHETLVVRAGGHRVDIGVDRDVAGAAGSEPGGTVFARPGRRGSGSRGATGHATGASRAARAGRTWLSGPGGR